MQIDAGLPLVRADAAQLERALANVLDNAGRYAGGDPVTVRARGAGRPAAAADRRSRARASRARSWSASSSRSTRPARAAAPGSGWRSRAGFVEANGGRIRAESLPGQGTTIVVELPVPAEQPAEVR